MYLVGALLSFCFLEIGFIITNLLLKKKTIHESCADAERIKVGAIESNFFSLSLSLCVVWLLIGNREKKNFKII
jgi:hypothetical protein